MDFYPSINTTRTSLNTKYVYNFRYLWGEMYNGYHEIENKWEDDFI